MRVLIPVHTFPPQSRYGAELYTYYLAKELTALGVQVHVMFTERGLARSEERLFEGLSCSAYPAAPLPTAANVDRPRPDVELAFRELLHRFRPDLVHLGHLLHLSTRLPQIAQEAGVPVLFTLHDYWLCCPRVKLLDRWERLCDGATASTCASCSRHRFSRLTWQPFESGEPMSVKHAIKRLVFMVERGAAARRLAEREREVRTMVHSVDRFIAPTAFLRDRVCEWGVPAGKVVVCDYGTAELTYDRRRRGESGSPAFGFIGGPTREKGVHILLGAFRGLSAARLIFYGASRDELLALFPEFADVIDQSNVVVKGRLTDTEKGRAVPELDALIVPSIWYENSPLVIHEAFAAGVPVVCSDIGGMAELVRDGVDGLHFKRANADDLRRIVTRCADDPTLLPGLARSVKPPKSFGSHVRTEILPLYRDVTTSRMTVPGSERVG